MCMAGGFVSQRTQTRAARIRLPSAGVDQNAVYGTTGHLSNGVESWEGFGLVTTGSVFLFPAEHAFTDGQTEHQVRPQDGEYAMWLRSRRRLWPPKLPNN